MARGADEYLVTLDIGTSATKVVIAQLIPEGKPRVVGVGKVPSHGMRRGSIVDIDEASDSIKKALEEAEKLAGLEITSAYVALGGAHLQSMETKGVIAVGKADGEVSQEDLDRVLSAAEAVSLPSNFEILHVVPRSFSLDNQEGIKDPIGMTGVRLELKGTIIYASTPHIKNVTKCLEKIGIGVESFVAAPLAVAKATLNKRQEELGAVAIDLGGGTVSMAVYEEQELIHLAVLPVGVGHVTNDIAIGLRVSVDLAEEIKLKYGSALPANIGKKEEVDLSDFDDGEEGVVPRKHVAEIIEARTEEIFYLVEKELKEIERSALLPAGAILSGGGANLEGVEDVAKRILKLPAQSNYHFELSGLVDKVDDPAFAVSAGMITWVLENFNASEIKGTASEFKMGGQFGQGVELAKKWTVSGKKWLSRFLP
ncbi:MAG TPA: cell division protein FtsA [Candidatus Moranbacteria bacterium]|nr:cell division protein FtsA [Candidatus Moranbacteria bacterium]